MVGRDTLIVDRSPQAADRLEKTTNSRSQAPQTQKCDMQQTNEENRQTHKLYHFKFQNCGAVYMDSFNASGVRTENCGNIVPQVTYYRPTIIDNEKGLHSQSHAVSSGPQNVAGSPIAPTEIAESNSSNVYLKTNALPQPQTIPPSHFSKDHTHHNIKYLEQLLDSSLATVAVIQFSGNTLADVLTPRAYDTFKALYALADLDAPVLSTKARGSASEIPTRSTFSDVGNDFPYSSNRSPPLPPTPSLAVSRTGRIHISISVDYVIYFSCAGLVAISGFVLFRLCERFFKM